MCYLLITKQLIEKPKARNADIIKKVMLEQMKRNDDGFALQRPVENLSLRTLDEEETIKAINAIDLDGMIYHARMASVGAVTTDNVHAYDYKGFTFAHNGGSSDYAVKTIWTGAVSTLTSKNQDNTDSKLFFYDLVDEIEARKATGHKEIAKAIQAQYNDVNWWGRASLYHKESDRLFLFGDWHTYNIGNEYIAISSADVLDIPQKTEKVRGLDFNTSPSGGIFAGELDGIAVIKNFSLPNWSLKFLSPLKDLTIDKVSGTTRVADAYKDFEGSPYTCQVPKLTKAEREELEAEALEEAKLDQEEWENYNDGYSRESLGLIELYNIDGERVETYDDGNEIHDTIGYCCDNGYCDMFYDTETEAIQANIDMAEDMEQATPVLQLSTNGEWVADKTEAEKDEIIERMLK